MSQDRESSSRTPQLAVRLAETAGDLAAVQRLRWQVFVEEMGARADDEDRLDRDRFDAICDHLLVTATDPLTGSTAVVGTYRLLRGSVAERRGGFYSAREFDLSALVHGARDVGDLLELGRSCVLREFRTSATIALLWRGISAYLVRHGIAAMFGCASFPGTNPAPFAACLSYLAHRHLAPADQCPRVFPGSGIALEQLARGTYDERGALLSLPPLIKGYLRAGAKFGDGAFVDYDFGTIDVYVVLPVDRLSSRYANRFSAAA